MADPATLSLVAKKALKIIATDPKILKKIVIGAFGIFAVILTLGTLILTTPSLLLTPSDDVQINATLNMYYTADLKVNAHIKQEIEKKAKAVGANQVVINDNSSMIEYLALMAVDSVRYNENFENVKEKDIIELAKKFNQVTYEVTTQSIGQGKNQSQITVLTATITSITFDELLDDLKFNDEGKYVAKSIYENSLDFNNTVVGEDTKNLEEYPAGNLYIPYYCQRDKRWGAMAYGNKTTMAASGCGLVAFAMVASGITHRTILPPEILEYSVRNGHCMGCRGTSWTMMKAAARDYGFSCADLGLDGNAVLSELSQGKPVIAVMGQGTFTRSAHYIVLYGLTADQKIQVYDPYTSKRNKAWDKNIVFSEARKFWSFE